LRREAALVVPWLADAVPFAAGPADLAAFAAAGRLLGRLHAVDEALGRRLPFRASAEPELAAMDGQLAALVESKHLPVELAARARAAVRRATRGPVLHGLTHGDFTAENLLVDAGGALRPVDNEGLGLGSLDLDLARTWLRWPMRAPAWRAFLDGYRDASGRPVDDEALHPWRLRTLVLSAWYRAEYGLPGLAEPLDRLRALAEPCS
jgi:aminoglycoside phosphotransferase (APT) family kinase protein